MDTKKICPGCGQVTSLVMGPSGEFIPVQPVEIVYLRVPGKQDMGVINARGPKGEKLGYYVIHLEVCPRRARAVA